MSTKPKLSFWQIWNMSFGFLGIQFGFALQNANVSRIFETLGARIEDIPILWIAAPVTGLIIQPIIGHMSDNTWGRLGRRRPYFLIGAILASIALFIMPNSPVLWVAAGMLWIMDASINISMEPFRAFVGDMLPSRQRTMGFSMQSFFIGTGAIIASALPWIMTNWFNVSNTAAEGEIPPSVKFAFYIGGIVFFLAVLWTVVRSREYSPKELEGFSKAEAEEKTGGVEATYVETPTKARKLFMQGSIWLLISISLFLLFYFFIYMDYGLGVFFGGAAVFGLLQILTGAMTARGMIRNGFVEVINDLYRMPKTMKQLAIVQFFSWFALFSMWIYTTAGVTATKYDMKLDRADFEQLKAAVTLAPGIPEAAAWTTLEGVAGDLDQMAAGYEKDEQVVATMRIVKFFTDEEKNALLGIAPEITERLEYIKEEYNTGADWVGVLMAVYNGFAAVMAFLIMWMARLTSRKRVHSISLLVGGISLVSFYFIASPNMLIIPELGIGLAWASILAMPYAILTGSLPSHKMGTFMGIFNFFIVIPQITAAAILGFFVRELFQNQAIYALVLGGISMAIAAVLVLFVDDVDEV
ncbi:MAG: MFS transporter [Bacteroidales bacterium]|nr:MFS transporter [Bacteroidales bacterium]